MAPKKTPTRLAVRRQLFKKEREQIQRAVQQRSLRDALAARLETVVQCSGCDVVLPLEDSYSPGDEALCATCDTEVTGREHPVTNEDRASFARFGLAAYAQRVGDDGEDFRTIAADFIGDLMHLCDVEGAELDNLLSQAEGHYSEELKEGA